MLISPTGFMSVTSMTGNSCAPLLFLVVLSVTVCRDATRMPRILIQSSGTLMTALELS